MLLSAAELLQALQDTEDAWEAREAEREWLAKWTPVWISWGHTMPGWEHVLANHPTS